MKQLVIVVIICSTYLSLYSQPDLSSFTKYQLLQFADNAAQMNDFISQAAYIEAYLILQPDDEKMLFELGTAYFKTKNYKLAANLFYQSYLNSKSLKWDAAYYYGLNQKHMGHYQEAKTYFELCINQTNKKSLAFNAREALTGCKRALDSISNYRALDIHHFGMEINSPHLDINPVFIDDETFLYISFNRDSIITYATDGSENAPSKEFNLAHKIDGSWILDEEKFMIDKFGLTDVSGGAFSTDRKRFYFTLSQKDWKNKSISSIYMAEKNGDSWTNPIPLPDFVNLKSFTSVHVSVGNIYNPDLEAIYFSSDRPGGRGGMDIWYTVYNKTYGTFIEPRNCGLRINTPNDEVTPFYHSEINTLFYSSNMLSGYGGFDVYKTLGSLNDWSKANLLEAPLNSHADEIYYSLNDDLISGFFVSNRPGTFTYAHEYCCYDIYSYLFKENELPLIKGKVVVSLDAVFSKYLNQGIKMRTNDSLAVYKDYYNETVAKLFLLSNNGESPMLIEEKSLADSGTYAFNVDKRFDYRIDLIHGAESIGTIDVDSESLSKNLMLESEVIEIAVVPNKPIEIEHIYYALNESELSDEAKANLKKTLIPLMIELEHITIEIHSHTDSIGSEDYNEHLSQKRADNVYYFLISEGINRKRVQSRGLGENHFIAPNSLPNGSDNPEGRRMNRRTEFIIVEY